MRHGRRAFVVGDRQRLVGRCGDAVAAGDGGGDGDALVGCIDVELSAAVMVTVPVLVVEPAAMVSFLLVLTEKSDAVAGDTAAAADTVSVTSWLDSALRVAVTVVEPPFSLDRRGAQLQGHSRRAVVVGDRQTSDVGRRRDAVAAGDRGGNGDAACSANRHRCPPR